MTTAFNRWLARPSTHDLLRQLLDKSEPCLHHSGLRRHHATKRAIAHTTTRPKRRGHPSVEETVKWNPLTKRKDRDHGPEKSKPDTPDVTKSDSDSAIEAVLGASTSGFGRYPSKKASGLPLLRGNKIQDLSFDTFRLEADVNNDRLFGFLLVDSPDTKNLFSFWIEILQFRQRVDGLRGVVSVWHGMRKRKIDLPVQGEEADLLWPTFIDAAIAEGGKRQEAFLKDIVSYAKDLLGRTDQYYSGLYRSIVGPLIRLKGNAPRHWHKVLSSAQLLPPNALKQIASYAMVEPVKWEFKTFAELYQEGKERDLYDDCMIKVLATLKDQRTVQDWHDLFLRNGDLPSQEIYDRPEIRLLYSMNRKRNIQLSELDTKPEFIDRFNTSENAPRYPPFTRTAMSSLVGEVHGIKPKEISDSFVARMFATRAFSLDLVIKGLGFLGVETLGPIATHELLIRAESLADLSEKLQGLRSIDVKLGNSTFCRLVQHIADSRDNTLFQLLVSSDQHPEAYDDARAQEALLVAFLEEHQLTKARLVLSTLSMNGANTSKTVRGRASNRLLQYYLKQQNWNTIALVMQQIRTDQIALTSTSIRYLFDHLLAERRRAHGPVESQRKDKPPFNSLDFVANAYVYTEKLYRSSGTSRIGGRVWVELLKRLSMRDATPGHWGRLEKLALWMARRFGSSHSHRGRLLALGQAVDLKQHEKLGEFLYPGRWIFSDEMQKAIFGWGFRVEGMRRGLYEPNDCSSQRTRGSERNDVSTIERQIHDLHQISESKRDGQFKTEPWAKGLALLKTMRTHGVNVQDQTIRDAFITRMWIMFGPAYSGISANEYIRRHNQLSLSHYVRHANEVWDGHLFPDLDPALLEPENSHRLLVAVFGPVHKTYSRPVEYADVRAWAEELHKAGLQSDTRSTAERKLAWEQGQFRLKNAVDGLTRLSQV